MLSSKLLGKRIAIWGMGREGKTTLAYFKVKYPENKIIIVNDKPLEGLDEDFIAEDNLLDNLDKFDVIVKSPGISYYHEAVTKMIDAGIEVTSATNIWFDTQKTGKVIAVTGSNGKSTTSAMTHHILKTLGLNAELGGNIGTPLMSLPLDADYYVVELSSYQTCDLSGKPDIAVLLNLFPEHIQWHKSHAQYYQDKCNLLKRGAAINIVNFYEPRSHNIAKLPIFFNDKKHIHFASKAIMDGINEIGKTDKFPMLGEHNLENLCASLSICKSLGLDLPNCLKAAYSYRGLPHRLQMFGPLGDHYYINDSISTDPEATIAALKALKGKDVTLIVGGEDREQNYDELCTIINTDQNINVICAYETGPRIFDQLETNQKHKTVSLKNSVKLAQKITPIEGYILLSPAAPSYDAFKDFEERGELFMELAKN